MTLPRIDKDTPEPLPGNSNSEVNPFYKSPIQNWDYFANDWKDHGIKYAIKCIKAGLKAWKKQTPKKN